MSTITNTQEPETNDFTIAQLRAKLEVLQDQKRVLEKALEERTSNKSKVNVR